MSMVITETEFVNREIRNWDLEYVEDLLDKGYKPTLLTDNSGNQKWVWLLEPTPVAVISRY